MKRFRKQFQGLYWRQLLVIVSMVMLTLFLLGASFFSLSYNYAKNQESGEMQERARMVAQLAAGYLNHSPDYDQENFRQLATVAATMTDVDFLISDTKGHVLLSTDETMEGKIINLPWDLTQAAIEGEGEFQRTDLNGLYDAKRFVAGVPVASGGTVVGVVFAVSTSASLNAMWQGFVGLFFMTAFVVLMVSFMASSVTAMRQIQPIREMVRATRRILS